MRKFSLTTTLILLLLFSRSATGQDEHLVRELMKERKFTEALVELEQIEDQGDPEIQFWRGVCRAAKNDHAKAIEIFENIRKEFPDSPFCDDAMTLTSCLEHLESTSDNMVTQFHQAVQHLANEHDQIRLEIVAKKQDSKSMVVQFGIDFSQEACQLHVAQNDKTTLQFETQGKGSHWFINNMDHIKAFKQKMFPVLSFEMEQMDDASFKFSLAGTISSSPGESKSTLVKMLKSHWMSTESGLRQLLIDRGMQLGCFPLSVENKNGTTICKWIQPDFDSGGLRESQFEFVDQRLAKLDYQDYTISLEHHKTGTMDLTTMNWPDVVVKETELDVVFISEFVTSIGRLGAGEAAPTRVAEGEKDKTIR